MGKNKDWENSQTETKTLTCFITDNVNNIYQPTPEGKQKPQMTYNITQIKNNLVPRAKSSPPRPPPQGDSKDSLTSTPLQITQIIMRNEFFFLSLLFLRQWHRHLAKIEILSCPKGFKPMIFQLKLSRCSSAELTDSTWGSYGLDLIINYAPLFPGVSTV